MTRLEISKFIILRSIGNFFVLFSLFIVIATFGPALYYEVSFRIMQARGVKYSVQDQVIGRTKPLEKDSTSGADTKTPSITFANVLTGPKEQILIPIDTNFNVLIPKIGANARVFANVDASDENEFLPLLQKGVAHAQGTVFPGMKGNIYLFAHSTDNFWNVGRYNAIFYLLKDLQAGDQVMVFFENKRHNYVVSESKVAEPGDVSYITNAQSGEEKLILQTCWPPGTTWKRLIVVAKPK